MAPRPLLAAAIAVGALAACAGERPADGAAAGGAEGASPAAVEAGAGGAPGDTVRHATRTVRREEGRCRREGIDSAAVPCVTVEIRYPELTAPRPAVAESLAAFVRRSAFAGTGEDTASATTADAAADGFVADYREIAAELGDRVEVWELERALSVACNSPRLVGLRVDEYVYTGGAHPNAWSRLATFDARTGRRLGLGELFVPESVPAVTRAAERAFRRERDIPAGQSLDSAGFIGFDDDRFALPENVLACDDRVTFRFDAYDVAPYVMGPTEFSVPVAELRAYLRTDVPLGR